MITKILNYYGFTGDEILKKKSHLLPEIRAEDLVSSILNNTKASDIADSLGVSTGTFSNLAKRVFSNKQGRGYWRDHLTKPLNLRTCSKCLRVLQLDAFSETSATCKKCDSARNSQYLKDNHGVIQERKAKFREENRDTLNLKAKEFYSRSPRTEEQKASKAKYDKDRGLDPVVRYKRNAYSAKRRAALRNAVPSWADLEAISLIYQSCPEGYHVDHIIPLQGLLVCGLHVDYNLQHLSAEDNLKKGNRHDE